MTDHWCPAIIPCDVSGDPYFGLIAHLPLSGFPIFEGLPYECPLRHLESFSLYCIIQGIHDDLISFYIFILTFQNEAAQWYKSLSPQSILGWQRLFLLFKIQFSTIHKKQSDISHAVRANLELGNHFEFEEQSPSNHLSDESEPIPPQCYFGLGPHDQTTRELFLEAKQQYNANPSLFLAGQ